MLGKRSKDGVEVEEGKRGSGQIFYDEMWTLGENWHSRRKRASV